MSSLVDSSGRPISSSARPILTLVLEGRTLNFGADTDTIRRIARESRLKALEVITKLLLEDR